MLRSAVQSITNTLIGSRPRGAKYSLSTSHCCRSLTGRPSFTDPLPSSALATEDGAGHTAAITSHAFRDCVFEEDPEEILHFHLHREPHLAPSVYFSKHPRITPEMRCKLVSWLVEVVIHFGLYRSTLHLGVYVFDRYLSVTESELFPSTDLQIIGLACLMIASKSEEIMPPALPSYAELLVGIDSDHEGSSSHGHHKGTRFWARRLSHWELDVLMTIRWHLVFATVDYWAAVGRSEDHRYSCCDALVDLALYDARTLQFGPSRLATAARIVTRKDDDHPDALLLHPAEEVQDMLPWLHQLYGTMPRGRIFGRLSEEDAYAANARLMEYVLCNNKH